jgi:hypothetical protein
MVVHVLYANLNADDVDNANQEELQNFNGHRFGSLAAFIAFRLITYRFFKFKQDAPQQLFSEEVHEAVPGSPLELSRSYVLESASHETQTQNGAATTSGGGIVSENPRIVAP